VPVPSQALHISAGRRGRNAAGTKTAGQIIGSQLADIVVQQTLEISGGLIANAEVDASGNLTDKGNLQIKAAAVIAKKLHDYDNGQSYGIGFSLSKNLSSGKIGIGAPVSYSFSDKERDILPTIGTCADIITSAIPGLNRSLNSHIGATSSDKASLGSVIPVSDICEFLQDKLTPAPDFKQLIQKDPNSNTDTDFDLLSNISEEVMAAYGDDLSSDELENLIKAAYNLHQFYKANPDKLKQGDGSLIQTCLSQAFSILHRPATQAEDTGVAAGENLGQLFQVGDFLGQLGEQIVDLFSLQTEQNQADFEKQQAKQQIDEWLNKKPHNLTDEESRKFAKIKSEVDDRYENLPSEARLDLTIRAYNLHNKLESRPDLVLEGTNFAMGIPTMFIVPPSGVANTEVPTSDVPQIPVPRAITKAVETVSEYYHGDDLTKILIIAQELGIVERNKVYEPSSVKAKPAVKSLATTSEDKDGSGICKVAHPYSPDDEIFKVKEDWMHPRILLEKEKQSLQGVQLYGLNPLGFEDRGGYISVHTELPGEETAARECFKNLTGYEGLVVLIDNKAKFTKPNGDVVMLRSPEASSSRLWKVDNHAKGSSGVYEKITFKGSIFNGK
jgi:hypothetical protein